MKKSCIIILAFISALPLLAQEQVPSVTPGVIARISMITPAFVLEMAPYTQYFTVEAPGRAAVWQGLQIVRSFVERNPHLSLNQVMTWRDYQELLRLSKYNP